MKFNRISSAAAISNMVMLFVFPPITFSGLRTMAPISPTSVFKCSQRSFGCAYTLIANASNLAFNSAWPLGVSISDLYVRLSPPARNRLLFKSAFSPTRTNNLSMAHAPTRLTRAILSPRKDVVPCITSSNDWPTVDTGRGAFACASNACICSLVVSVNACDSSLNVCLAKSFCDLVLEVSASMVSFTACFCCCINASFSALIRCSSIVANCLVAFISF